MVINGSKMCPHSSSALSLVTQPLRSLVNITLVELCSANGCSTCATPGTFQLGNRGKDLEAVNCRLEGDRHFCFDDGSRRSV